MSMTLPDIASSWWRLERTGRYFACCTRYMTSQTQPRPPPRRRTLLTEMGQGRCGGNTQASGPHRGDSRVTPQTKRQPGVDPLSTR